MMKHVALTLILAVGLVGCATDKSLYGWGTYEQQVYAYLTGESPEEQTVQLEKDLAEILKKGEVPPPGFYASLGLLYSKIGRDAETIPMLDKEVSLYPEAKTFVVGIKNGFKGAK